MLEVPGSTPASPAATEPAAAAPVPATSAPKSASERLSELTPEQRHEWRKTGQLPDAAPAASAPASAATPPAATAATSEPVSEPAADDPDYKPKTAKRIKELLDRAEKAERALAASRTPAQPAAPAASAPAPAAAASTLVKPDPDKFTYGTADPQYLEALTEYTVKATREQERREAAENERKTRTSAEVKRIQESWKTRVEAAKAKHADFESVALATDTKIPQGSLIDSWILESEHGAEVLYELQKNPAEVDRLLTLSPLAQTRELVQLELRLIADVPKVVTTAPDPGQVLGARAGDPTKDPVRKAIKSGDAGAYIREMNEREIAAKRPRK